MGVRVFSLAKELGMTSKDLIAFLRTQGHNVKSHMASIDDTVAQILRDRMKPKTPPKPAKAVAKGTGAKKDKKKEPAAPGPQLRRPTAGAAATIARGTSPETPRIAAASGGAEAPAPAARDEKDRPRESRARPRKVRYFPSDDFDHFQATRYGGMRRRVRAKGDARGAHGTGAASAVRPERIELAPPVTVKDLSASLGIKAPVILKKLMDMGQMATINQYLKEDVVANLGIELGTEIVFRKREDDTKELVRALEAYENKAENLVPRAPVVTFLGHVDHGKTSLLDKIRETNVTQKEHGGITQHLGAYRIDKGDVHVTFIDTPGHKAFTEMRARGAHVTDVAVLVVAADDGPMPQTEEAISHARAAKVPIIVALNKCDLPAANPLRCKEALSKLGLMPVEWNGDTEYVEVSARTGQGLDDLVEILSLESQILELKANPHRPAAGVVLEAESTTTRGVLATVLVKDGTLRVGDYVLCGASHGRVRSLLLNGTEPVREAAPATPVKVVGLNKVPEAGDRLFVVSDPKQAMHIAEQRGHQQRESEMVVRQKLTLENLFKHLEEGFAQELNLVLKADVRGSIEALRSSVESLSTEEVKVRIVHAGVGPITQEDILLANASGAIIIGFHVSADDRIRTLAEENHVEIRLYQVIYHILDDIKAAMEARLQPELVEEVHGHAEVRQVFHASRVGSIAGCLQTDGHVKRNDKVRVLREGRVVFTGDVASLKRFKEDVREVREGFECGIKVAGFDDVQVGDVIEAFALVEKRRNL